MNVWPEPLSSAAGLRTRELAAFIQRLNYDLTIVAPLEPSPHSQSLEESGVRCITCDPNSTPASEQLKSLSPRLVIYDRFYTEEKYGWRAREFWPEALHMIDTIDLHCLRGARQKAQAAGSNAYEDFLGDDFLREMASLHRADVCLVVSEFEAEWLIKTGFESERVCYLPFSAKIEPSQRPLADRKGYAFIGNYMHAPNVDAVRWLEKDLWPALRAEMPKAELHLYGAYPTQSVSQLHGKNGIFAHGFVEDHRKAISQHEVMLAPLRYGAGIKGKVLEAWATGTPVLGTAIAFESMGKGFAEFSTPHEFVEQLLKLKQPDEWKRNVDLGLRQLNENYDEEKIFHTFSQFLDSSFKALRTIRSSLTGRLLRHHGAQSLKYFSLWIEEKNKNR